MKITQLGASGIGQVIDLSVEEFLAIPANERPGPMNVITNVNNYSGARFGEPKPAFEAPAKKPVGPGSPAWAANERAQKRLSPALLEVWDWFYTHRKKHPSDGVPVGVVMEGCGLITAAQVNGRLQKLRAKGFLVTDPLWKINARNV